MSSLVEVIEKKGWSIYRLSGENLQVDVLPGKGGDILGVRWLPLDIELLWTTPWGLREKGSVSTATDSVSNFLENYPGGWQTIFPNGGDPCVEDGVELGFHGEACLIPWTVEKADGGANALLELNTTLIRSPFSMSRRVEITDDVITVTERVTSLSDSDLEVMWSHHPAFGRPLVSEGAVITSRARTFVADDVRDTEIGDLEPGSRTAWPSGRLRSGEAVDLSRIPEGPCDRFGYLTDFEAGFMSINNSQLGIAVDLSWNEELFPHAWFWLEKHATAGYPWFGRAYVLGIEPASSYPGQGVANVRAKTGTLLRFMPDETKELSLRMEVRPL